MPMEAGNQGHGGICLYMFVTLCFFVHALVNGERML